MAKDSVTSNSELKTPNLSKRSSEFRVLSSTFPLEPYSKTGSERARGLQRGRPPEVGTRDRVFLELLVHPGDVEHVQPQRGIVADELETLFQAHVDEHREREACAAAAIGLDGLGALCQIGDRNEAGEGLSVTIVRRKR